MNVDDWPDGEHWRADARCASAAHEGADFYNDDHGVDDLRVLAASYCAACPVADRCLAYAIDHDLHGGLWGGLDDRARRRIAPTKRTDHREYRAGRAYERARFILPEPTRRRTPTWIPGRPPLENGDA